MSASTTTDIDGVTIEGAPEREMSREEATARLTVSVSLLTASLASSYIVGSAIGTWWLAMLAGAIIGICFFLLDCALQTFISDESFHNAGVRIGSAIDSVRNLFSRG